MSCIYMCMYSIYMYSMYIYPHMYKEREMVGTMPVVDLYRDKVSLINCVLYSIIGCCL